VENGDFDEASAVPMLAPLAAAPDIARCEEDAERADSGVARAMPSVE
jgi:hypothetical protein